MSHQPEFIRAEAQYRRERLRSSQAPELALEGLFLDGLALVISAPWRALKFLRRAMVGRS